MPTRPISSLIQNQMVHTVERETTVRAASRIMASARIGSVMVVDKEGSLVGIFTERDALFRVLAHDLNPDRTTIGEVMTADPETVTADRSLVHALHMMHDGGYRHMPVVDREGHPAGMVSVRDALGMEMMTLEREEDDKAHLTEIIA